MSEISFILDDVTPSQNPWDRTNKWEKMEIKKYWGWLVKIAAGVVKPEQLPKHVHIVRVSKRLIDDQNIPAGCKYLVDALQDFGHIWCDSRKWTRVTFDQRKCRPDETPHMEVTISPQGLPS